MGSSNIIKNMVDGSISCTDGSGAVITTIKFEMGDAAVTGIQKVLNEKAVYESRGKVRSVRHTTRKIPQLTLSAMMAEFTSTLSDNIPITDVIYRPAGSAWASATSTRATTGDVFCVDVTLTWRGTTLGDSADHTMLLEDVHFLADFAEGDPNKWSVTGDVYGSITLDGIAVLAEVS